MGGIGIGGRGSYDLSSMLAEPEAILKQAIHFSETPPHAVVLVSQVITRETAEKQLLAVSS